jgi:hypothetical protein
MGQLVCEPIAQSRKMYDAIREARDPSLSSGHGVLVRCITARASEKAFRDDEITQELTPLRPCSLQLFGVADKDRVEFRLQDCRTIGVHRHWTIHIVQRPPRCQEKLIWPGFPRVDGRWQLLSQGGKVRTPETPTECSDGMLPDRARSEMHQEDEYACRPFISVTL